MSKREFWYNKTTLGYRGLMILYDTPHNVWVVIEYLNGQQHPLGTAPSKNKAKRLIDKSIPRNPGFEEYATQWEKGQEFLLEQQRKQRNAQTRGEVT